MKLRALLMAGTLIPALCLGACTTAQEQSVLNAINVTCTALPVGTEIAITVASSIAGGAVVATFGNEIAATETSVCSQLLAGVKVVIDEINAGGGVATVSVATTAPSGAKRHYKMTFRPHASTPQVYVVPPAPHLLPFF